MPRAGKSPASVRLCNLMIGAAARLVPEDQRGGWQREWAAEIWHRWQFLFHAGLWSRREAWGLIRTCLGAFPDAVWHFALQDPVQDKVRNWARSPWTCLGVLAFLLVILGLFTSGFPATRQLAFSGADINHRLLYIRLHPTVGGGDKELPPDAPSAWAAHSKLLEGVAGFHITHQQLSFVSSPKTHPVVIATEPALFAVLRAKPVLGAVPGDSGVVIDQRTWKSIFHRNPHIIGTPIVIGRDAYRIAAVLPADFQFLTRRPSVFVVRHWFSDHVNVIARTRPGVTLPKLDRELVGISEDVTYDFFKSQLRMSYLEDELRTPLLLFGVAAGAAVFFALWASRVRGRQFRAAWRLGHRVATVRRCLFFLTKTALALSIAFVAGLEWARSQSAILFSTSDPASGPFLLWLYILAAMGVLFWAVADQRARCRICMRLLCFPVRIGCPGCLLLDWSGTELLCSQGHGVLHVPHMAPSWEEESERWISLDESWKSLFAPTK